MDDNVKNIKSNDESETRKRTKSRDSGKTKKKKAKNRESMAVVYTFMLLFFGLIGYLVYYNATIKENVVNNTYNKRIEVLEKETIRGSILANDGSTILARTVIDSNGNEVREYPFGNIFAHVVGYTYKGKYGLEKAANYYLISSNDNPINQVKNDFEGNKNAGDSVVTTLDVDLQKAAYNALGNNNGAVVCIEPSTGKILAMVSRPDFDPNIIELTWDTIITDNTFDSVLVNRATQGLYAPGSTFKVFTLLEYIRENPKDYEDFSFNCVGNITFEGIGLSCFNGRAHGSLSLIDAFAESCNSAFATIGLHLDKQLFRENNLKLLFNQELPLDIEYNESSFAMTMASGIEETMHTAMGQGQTLMTPIHNCMMAAAIANNGVLMKPYLTDKLVNFSGSTIRRFGSEEYKTLMTKNESSILTEYMSAVVTEGTGTVLKNNNYTVAGKTGSAQYDSSNLHHSWFLGFAPVEDPQIAICVIMEGGYTGYTNSTEVAKIILDEYLN